MQRLWAEFARTGTPRGWTPFAIDAQNVLKLSYNSIGQGYIDMENGFRRQCQVVSACI